MTVPRQLPTRVPHFAGRAGELALLDGVLDEAASDRAAGATGVVISAIGGTAGVGKTALALHWAHRVAHQFKDGQLYANLRGFDTGNEGRRSADVLRGFLGALGVHPERRPPTPRGSPRCTGRSSPGGGCSCCSTTPPTSPRCGRCCPPRPTA